MYACVDGRERAGAQGAWPQGGAHTLPLPAKVCKFFRLVIRFCTPRARTISASYFGRIRNLQGDIKLYEALGCSGTRGGGVVHGVVPVAVPAGARAGVGAPLAGRGRGRACRGVDLAKRRERMNASIGVKGCEQLVECGGPGCDMKQGGVGAECIPLWAEMGRYARGPSSPSSLAVARGHHHCLFSL